MADGNKEQIQEAINKLDKEAHRLAELLYKKADATPGPAAGSSDEGQGGEARPSGKEGEVIDAEYVDVDESQR